MKKGDHAPPIGVFHSAESFLLAAQLLQNAEESEELSLRFDLPIYHLYCHALELTMKAFLRTKGYSEELLASRKFGHKLQVLWDACVDEGLHSHQVTDAVIADIIEMLDPFAASLEFRYRKGGKVTRPMIGAVESAVVDLMVAVEPHCRATGPIP